MAKIDPANISQTQGVSAKEVSEKQATQAQTTSEAGGIAKGMGSVINSWSDKLNSALQDWYNVNTEIQDKLDNAKFVVQEIQYAKSHYEWCVRSGVSLYIPSGNYDKLMDAMSLLGIPPSQRATGTLMTSGSENGKYHMTESDFKTDYDLMVQYAKDDFSSFSGEISSLQQQETKIQLQVMYAFTGIQTNQKTTSGILSNLKQLAQSVLSNVQ